MQHLYSLSFSCSGISCHNAENPLTIKIRKLGHRIRLQSVTYVYIYQDFAVSFFSVTRHYLNVLLHFFAVEMKRARQFRMEELEQASRNFDESNLIGYGTFGLVYKGILNDGTIVAIKRRNGYPRQDFSEEVFQK